jgi:cytochrome c oxidase subunit 2
MRVKDLAKAIWVSGCVVGISALWACSTATKSDEQSDVWGCLDPRAKLAEDTKLCYTCLPYEELVETRKKGEPYACRPKDCVHAKKCAVRGAVFRPAVWVRLPEEGQQDEPVALRPESAARGKEVAERNGCFDCHTTDGSEGRAPSWKGLFGSLRPLHDGSAVRADETYLRESVLRPDLKKSRQVGRVYRDSMPTDMGGRMTDDELDDLLAYIKSLK